MPRPRVFYGWWIAVALLVVLIFSHGMAYYLIPVMLPQFIEDFGWSRTAVSGIASVLLLALGLLSPPVGRLCDRWGARRVMLLSAPFLAIALALLGTVHSLWQLYAIYVLLSVAATGLHTVPVSTVITRWFDHHRGAAMGLAMSGMSVGGFLVGPLAGYLNAALGWRATFVIMGAAAAVLLLLLTSLVIKSGPPPGQAPPPSGPAPQTLRASRLLRQPDFWLVTISFTLVSGSFVGVLTHLVAFMKDTGMDAVAAAGTLGLVAGIGIAGKLASGYLGDRMSRVWLSALVALLQAAGLVVVMVSYAPVAIWAFAVLFGLAVGAVAVVRPLVMVEFFGSDGFGANYGWMLLFSYLGSAAGPPFAGYIYDTTGSYSGAFTTFVLAYLASVVCLLLARRLHRA